MVKNILNIYRTFRRARTEDLEKKCYRKIRVQKLSQDQKPIRKSCSVSIRKNISHGKV